MDRIIGVNKSGEIVRVNTAQTKNLHEFVSGKSGCGKTTVILGQIIAAAEAGETTVVVNWRNCINRSMIMPELKDCYNKFVKVIDAAKDGIPLPLFKKIKDSSGREETDANVAHRVTSLLKIAGKLTPTQEGQVCEAVKYMQRQGLYENEGIAVLGDWLNNQKRAVAKNAASKLRSIVDGNIFVNGDFWEDGVKIYEFDLNGLEYDDQLVISRFLMDYFLRLANTGKFCREGLNIFLDECQNMDFEKGSTMYTLINESRRLNIRAFLAAPSIISSSRNGMEVLSQCGVCLYFETLEKDRRKVAGLIDPLEEDSWVFALSRLKKGRFVARGSFKVNGKAVDHPIQLSTYLPIKNQSSKTNLTGNIAGVSENKERGMKELKVSIG